MGNGGRKKYIRKEKGIGGDFRLPAQATARGWRRSGVAIEECVEDDRASSWVPAYAGTTLPLVSPPRIAPRIALRIPEGIPKGKRGSSRPWPVDLNSHSHRAKCPLGNDG